MLLATSVTVLTNDEYQEKWVREWVDDETCDEEREGKDSKHDVTRSVVLAVFAQLRKLIGNTKQQFYRLPLYTIDTSAAENRSLMPDYATKFRIVM